MRLLRALIRNRAATAPSHPDPGLRTRRYPVPLPVVRQTARQLADGGLPRWVLTDESESDGWIRAEATTRVLRFVDDVEIRIRADGQGQTRVDVRSESRVGVTDLGANARRIRRFLRHLDRAMAGHD
ncbi:MAG: DUF1499 domain-containing protein [Gemmatimonadales bacterium]|nr:MAG: DUF1499 domain-containing protein [Gemmatimonadales bacterium]